MDFSGKRMVYDSYHIDHAKGLMIVDCTEVKEEPDLREPKCLRAILKHLSKELRVEGLVLNHYREKHYGEKTLKTLQEILNLSSFFDQLAGQEPIPDFSSLSKKEINLRCSRCAFNSSNLFKRLKDLLLGDLPNVDFPAFAAEFTVKVKELSRHKYTGCHNCTARTVDDLSFLLTQIELFSNRILASIQWRHKQ